MEKVYAKFTKERGKAFRIETAIYQGKDGTREVVKTPLSFESVSHVAKMYENSQYFAESGLLLPCTKRGESVVFPFITGKSFYQLLLEAREKEDKDCFLHILKRYHELLTRLYPDQKPFEMTEAFEQVFGQEASIHGMESAVKLNVDLTFDNIMIQNGKPQILDYEWIFDFPMPVKFAVYRAVYALWVKNGSQFTDFMGEEELYATVGISDAERMLFYHMNEAFMRYVEDGEFSYTKMLKRYRKPALEFKDQSEDQGLFAQLFWKNSEGYNENQSENYDISASQKDVRLEKELSQILYLQEVRIDPLNVSAMLKDLRVVVETENGKREIGLDEMRTNLTRVFGGYYLFDTEDPQMLLSIPEGEVWKSIHVEYQIVAKRIDRLHPYKEVLESGFAEQYGQLEAQYHQLRGHCEETEEKLLEQTVRLQETAELLEQKESLLAQCQAKLACIENSRIYKSLLKSKIDKIEFGEEQEEAKGN